MDIRSKVKQQVAQLATQSTATRGRQTVHIAWQHGNLDVLLDDVQSLGCSMWQLEVHFTTSHTVDQSQLGQRIADRVRYLLEPLEVHEIDEERREVQLRSWPPHREDRTVRYYEVTLLADDSLRVVRYEKSPSAGRFQIPAVLTVEVLAQLCQDVADLVSA